MLQYPHMIPEFFRSWKKRTGEISNVPLTKQAFQIAVDHARGIAQNPVRAMALADYVEYASAEHAVLKDHRYLKGGSEMERFKQINMIIQKRKTEVRGYSKELEMSSEIFNKVKEAMNRENVVLYFDKMDEWHESS